MAPTLLVPDGSFMIDRRMGVHGYPLEIQALFYGTLLSARELIVRHQGRTGFVDYDLHWDELIGEMPAKIVHPAVSGREWMYMHESDPKHAAWSYHNGGHRPVLLWPFVGAALTTGRRDLAQRAMGLVSQ